MTLSTPRKRCEGSVPAFGKTALDIAGGALAPQLGVIRHNAKRALRLRDAEAIHDLRVAIRRFRTALKAFAKPLQGTSARRLRRDLFAVNRRLGPIRDAQVWEDILVTLARRKNAPRADAWTRCLREAGKARAALEFEIGRVLGIPRFEGLLRRCDRLLQVEIPARNRGDDEGTAFVARRLRRTYLRLLRVGAAPAFESVEATHRFRRRCRRARYLAEFAEPCLGAPAKSLARRFKAVADALGARHDAELHLEKLNGLPNPPPELRRALKRRRQTAREDFLKAWRRLLAPRYRTRVLTALQAAAKGAS